MPSKHLSMRVRRTCTFILTLVMLFSISACRKKKSAKPMSSVPQGYKESGIASWYGHPYHGRRAANGEVYDMDKMTAAHRTLPFETIVRVVNLDNGKSTEVRITDRGPFIDGRIIDLSRAAARDIDLIRPGTAKVRIEAIRLSASPVAGTFGVQVGAFREKKNAERLRSELAARYNPVDVVEGGADSRLWRVVVGRRTTSEAAQDLADTLQRETGKAFVIRLD